LALELGAAFLGVILTAKSARFVPLDRAQLLVGAVRRAFPTAQFFGVFVNESPEELSAAWERLGLSALQIHGDCAPAIKRFGATCVVPAVGVRDDRQAMELVSLRPEHPAVLADSFAEGAHGGTGKVFNHALIRPVIRQRRVFLAGGLTPDNIAGVVAALGPGDQPYAYDLSSGVEAAPGVKSEEKMRRFFAEYERALAVLSGEGTSTP
jgi:phosphoribosylanthranilate isomerase